MKSENMRPRGLTGLILVSFLGLGIVLPGCAGHGKYTTEHINAASEKMSVMKAATEWEMGRQAFLAGDLEKAERKVEASLSINQNVAKSHVLHGRIMIERGDLGKALTSLRTAEAIDPNHIEAHYYLGIVHERLDQIEDALTHYQRAAELDEYDSQYTVAAAEMMIDLGRIEEARVFLTEGPLFEHSAGVRQALGHIAMIENNLEVAARMFNEARLLSPEDTAILEDLIRAQMGTSDFAQAEFNLSRLLRDPEFANRRDLKHMQAHCLLAVSRPVEARAVYFDLIDDAAGQSDVQAWIGLGNVAYLLEDERQLRRAASRVVAIAPDRHEGYSLFALLHRHNGDSASALSSLEEAITRSPQDEQLRSFRDLVRREVSVAAVPTD